MKFLNIVAYEKQPNQMGDLLKTHGAFPVRDKLTKKKRERIKRQLERYLSGKKHEKKIFHIKKSFFLEIHSSDEAGYLYWYFT